MARALSNIERFAAPLNTSTAEEKEVYRALLKPAASRRQKKTKKESKDGSATQVRD